MYILYYTVHLGYNDNSLPQSQIVIRLSLYPERVY